jgi:hypothetical protein
MTVHIVTLNALIEGVYEDAEGADARMAAIRASEKFKREAWRPVGNDAWTSPQVKLLKRRAYMVEA